MTNLDNRIVALERQLADLLRAEEENGSPHRAARSAIEAAERECKRAHRRARRQARRGGTAAVQAAAADTEEPKADAAHWLSDFIQAEADQCRCRPTTAADPAEEAYDTGYQLWKAGKYDEADRCAARLQLGLSEPSPDELGEQSRRPGHARQGRTSRRRGGLLANYRGNPKGERAADSLFYLGQSLMKLDQPSQACKAYAELEAVYGSTMRADLQKHASGAKSQAKCRGCMVGDRIWSPIAELVDRFRADLDALIEPGTRFGVAVSGGPDSLALLLLAAAARPGELEAATVDHGLRAEAATKRKRSPISANGSACRIPSSRSNGTSLRPRDPGAGARRPLRRAGGTGCGSANSPRC